MARTVSTEQLVTDCRARTKIEAASVSNADVVAFLQAGNAALQDVILEVSPMWDLDSFTIDVVSGTSTYALDPDFYKLRGVDVKDASGQWRDIDEIEFYDRNLYQDSTGTREEIKWMLIGDNIRLYPTPGYSETAGLRVWFVPAFTVITWDGVPGSAGTLVDYHNDWCEYIRLYACILMKEALRESPVTYAGLLSPLDKRLRRAARRRSHGKVKTWSLEEDRERRGRRCYPLYGKA
jgi:hypothetical protein